MARYRCPQCGAGHSDPPTACRLCGQIMDGTVGQVQVQRRYAPRKEKKGVGAMALIGVAVVAALGVSAVLLGLTTGNLSYAGIRNRVGEWIPALASKDDGWAKVTDAEGGFTIDIPQGQVPVSVLYPPATNGHMVGWSSHIGSDTQLSVQFGKVVLPTATTKQDAVNRFADGWIFGAGRVDKRADTNFHGYPAVDLNIKDIKLFGADAYKRVLVFLKGDALYVVQAQSIYPDNPSFGRFVDSLRFTA